MPPVKVLDAFAVLAFFYNEAIEKRSVSNSQPRATNYKAGLTLRESIAITNLETSVELFDVSRDSYYSSGGDVKGFKLSQKIGWQKRNWELSNTIGYRLAESELPDETKIYSIGYFLFIDLQEGES